jgi:PAS domain S-box-containing protein
MQLLQMLSLLGAFSLALVGYLVFRRNPSGAAQRVFVALCLVGMAMGIGEFLSRSAPDPEAARQWLRLLAAWPLAAALQIHVALLLSDAPDARRPWWFSAALYLPPLALVALGGWTDALVGGVTLEPWGWEPLRPRPGVIARLAHGWVTATFLILTVVLLVRLRRAGGTRQRRRLGLLLVGTLLPNVSGAASVALLPALGLRIPDLNGLAVTVMAVLFLVALERYGLFEVSPVTAARNIVAALPGYLFLADNDRRLVEANAPAARCLGLPAELLRGQPLDRLFSCDVGFEHWLVEATAHADAAATDGWMIAEDRPRVPVRVEASVVRHRLGDRVGYVLIATDLSCEHSSRAEIARLASGLEARVAARTADLTASEEKYRQLVDDNPSGVLVVAQGKVVYANRVAARVTGAAAPAALVGLPLVDLVHPDSHQSGLEAARRVNRTRTPLERLAARARRLDGSTFDVEAAASYVEWQGEPALQLVFDDYTARRSAEAELRASHQRYRQLVETIPDAVAVTDELGRIQLVNPAGAALLGVSEQDLVGRPWMDFVALSDRDAALDLVGQHAPGAGGSAVAELAFRKQSGERFVASVRCATSSGPGGLAEGFITVIRDVTELKQLEEQFRQAQKLEAVGQLAGGIAHDFNNIMMVILNCAEMALERTAEEDLAHHDLEEIQKAASRAAELTRQLLAFSRRQAIEPRDLELSEAVGQFVKLLRRLIGEHIQLDLDLPPNAGVVQVDPAQLQQIVINLAVNARDAMPGGGWLRIAVGRQTVTSLGEGWPLPPAPGTYVVLSVTDTGAGIPGEVLPKIFEPFFTTKEVGKGTGLGLAMVYGAVRQNQGFLEVDSHEGMGTSFHVYLPLAHPTASHVVAPTLGPALQGAGEAVLVVEDDPTVQLVLQRTLTASGYRVTLAPDGVRALELFQASPEPFSVVLTDIIMPQMNGVELAERLLELQPTVRVAFLSGYTDDLVGEYGIPERGWPLLRKPVDRRKLLETLRRLIRRSSAQTQAVDLPRAVDP